MNNFIADKNFEDNEIKIKLNEIKINVYYFFLFLIFNIYGSNAEDDVRKYTDQNNK